MTELKQTCERANIVVELLNKSAPTVKAMPLREEAAERRGQLEEMWEKSRSFMLPVISPPRLLKVT